MRCRAFQKEALFQAGQALSGDLQVHVDHCAECRAWLEAQQKVVRLMGLMNQERPDAGFEERNALNIHRRIVELEAAKRQAEKEQQEKLLDWMFRPVRAWRYAGLALLLAGALWITQKSPESPETALNPATAPVPAETPAVPAVPVRGLPEIYAGTHPTALPLSAPPPTNHTRPKRIQYGSGNTRVVDFEY